MPVSILASALLLGGACSKKEGGEGSSGKEEAAAEVMHDNLRVHGDLYVHGKVVVVGASGKGAASLIPGGHHDALGAGKGGTPPGASGVKVHAQGSPAAQVESKWSYQGDLGPKHWAEIYPGADACLHGRAQSPVDIEKAEPNTLGSIDFVYRTVPLAIRNDGRTVRIQLDNGGYLEFAAKRYRVVDIAFHSPSEHHVRGRHYDFVAHIQHRSDDGEILMVAVPYVQGKKHLVLDAIWKYFPTHRGKLTKPQDVLVSAESFLPGLRSYYTYIGSLTRPPCSEGVRWILLKTPTSVSSAQIARFERAFPHSTRPLQPLHDRTVGQGR